MRRSVVLMVSIWLAATVAAELTGCASEDGPVEADAGIPLDHDERREDRDLRSRYETEPTGPFGSARGHCFPGSTSDPFAA